MEGDRKYNQRGYQDPGREFSDRPRSEDRARPQGPKTQQDAAGPRLPRLVQAVAASRCFSCATTLPADIDFRGECPKCRTALHCCKQCTYFDPSTRFQCQKPILVRSAVKDQANECELFKPRVTVARDSVQQPAPAFGSNGSSSHMQESRTPSNARVAFDNLFRKTE